ncbi:MAG: sugar transferase [Deltaproteobacteria bacterium]|nr:sugar transferase [Deltaproteobacteria bacterium]
MGLKYLVVTRESERSYFKSPLREFVFVVHPEEEMKVRAALREAPQKMDIVMTKHLEDVNSYAELDALLTPDRSLGVTSQPVTQHEVSKIVLNAHIRGARIIDFESALMELIPSVPSNLEEIVKVVAKGGVHQRGRVRTYARIKNFAEPAIAAVLLLLLSPLLVLVALMVKFTSPGPVLYGQKRLGLGGKEFEILKFRSMRTDAEKNGPVWATEKKGDSRLSPIGGFLRAAHLDELPQFINILRGEISFIGPRPERKIFSDQLEKEIPMFPLRTLVKPGITGWAQIRQGYANSVEDSRKKLELDFYYILKHSPRLDALVVLNTLGVLVSGGTEGKKRELTAATTVANATVLPTARAMAAKRSSSRRLQKYVPGMPMLSARFRLRRVKSRAAMRSKATEARVESNRGESRAEG